MALAKTSMILEWGRHQDNRLCSLVHNFLPLCIRRRSKMVWHPWKCCLHADTWCHRGAWRMRSICSWAKSVRRSLMLSISSTVDVSSSCSDKLPSCAITSSPWHWLLSTYAFIIATICRTTQVSTHTVTTSEWLLTCSLVLHKMGSSQKFAKNMLAITTASALGQSQLWHCVSYSGQ